MIAFILNPLTLWISGAVVAAGVTGYVVVDQYLSPEKKPETVVEEKSTELAALPEKPPEIKAEVAPKPIEYPLPKFDILRVEKDGSAVIAGSAPSGSKVEIFDTETIIATEKSGPSGQFVAVLDKPLSPGAHELTIHATLDDGRILISAEAGIINVPDGGDDLVAMVTEPGEASKIMQMPEPKPEPKKEVEVASIEPEPKEEPAPVVEAPKPVEKIEKIEEPKPVEKIEEPKPVVEEVEEPKPVVKVEEPKQIEPEPKEPEPAKPLIPVLIQAAEVEGDKLFIAGTGQPGMMVHLYINGKILGNAEIGEQGSYLFEGNSGLKAGRHAVRADMTDKGSVEVLARAVVSLLHEPVVVKPVEVAKVEPKVEAPKPVEKLPEPEPEPEVKEPVEVAVVEEKVEAPEPPKVAEPMEEPKVEEPKVEEPKMEEPKVEVAAVAVEPPKEIVTGSSVIIRKGDSLWQVSRRHYGHGVRYTTIFEANREQIRDPHLIFPGQVFDVPEFKEPDQE